MTDLIIFLGTAGIGKTTTGEYLQQKFGYTLLNYGKLRQKHKDLLWETYSAEEDKAYQELTETIEHLMKKGKKILLLTTFLLLVDI